MPAAGLPDPDEGVRRWRCARDPLHAGVALVPTRPPLPAETPASRWVCPYCAAPVALEPAPSGCAVCGAAGPLVREMSPSGHFERFCARHDPRARVAGAAALW